MAQVIFYEKPGCGGNTKQKQLLSRSGHDIVARDLLAEPWEAATLLAFLASLPVAAWFNRAHPKVKAGDVVPEAFDADTALAALLADHLLIRRPLMQVGDERRVGWDEAAVADWIGLAPAGLVEGCPRGDGHRCD
jgi:nitrogenase-associated protein